MSVARLVGAGLAAAGVTLGLFALMQALIDDDRELALRSARAQPIEFLRLDAETELETTRRLPRRAELDEPPPPPPLQPVKPPLPRGQALDIDAPALRADFALSGGPELGTAASDAEAIPLVRVDPVYPPRAAARGIEGWVEVRFTISAAGTVSEAEVVAAEPSSIFNRAALKAIRRWKYKPRIEDGQPVTRPGQRVVLTFKLEKR